MECVGERENRDIMGREGLREEGNSGRKKGVSRAIQATIIKGGMKSEVGN